MSACAWCALTTHSSGRYLTPGAAAVQRGRWLAGRALTEGRRHAAGPGAPGDRLRGDSGYFVAWLLDITRGLDAGRAHTELVTGPGASLNPPADLDAGGRRFPSLAAVQW